MQEEVIKEEIGDLISLALAKKHLRVEDDYTDDDELIALYITAAENTIENFIERPLKTQTTIYTTNAFQDFVFERSAFNAEVEKIQYWESLESEPTELPKENYSVTKQNSETYKVAFKNVPENVVKVCVYITQGYDDKTLPAEIKHALLLLLTEAYDKRDNIPTVINTKAKSLVLPYRKWLI